MASISKKTQIQKTTLVSVSTLKFNNIIDITGDEISYENLTQSIETYGVMSPIFITKDKFIISGNRRAQISKDLLIDNIPAIVVNESITPVEIEKLKIDFLLTHRNISHLDIIQVYYYQHSVFEQYNEPYTEYMAKLKECSQRNIQLKVKAGEMYSNLSDEIKKVFQDLDHIKKIPFKTFKIMSHLEEIDLQNCVEEILKVKNIEHKKLTSIINEYQEMINRKKRHIVIDKEAQNSKDSREEILNNDESINELNSLKNSNNTDNSVILNEMKKVFQYQIKKSFKLTLETNEERDMRVIQSKLNIDFKEEIKLIKSLLEGTL